MLKEEEPSCCWWWFVRCQGENLLENYDADMRWTFCFQKPTVAGITGLAVFGMVLWESGGDKCTPLAGHRGIFSKLESSRWVEMDHFLHGIWAGDRSYRVLCIREDESRTGFRPSNLGKSRKGLSRCFILGCGAVCWGTCASQSNGRFSGRSVSEDGGGALAGVSLLGPWNRVDRLATGPGDDQSTTGEATRMERRWITCGTWRWWYMIDESNPKDMGDARWYSLRRWWLIPCS